MATKLTGEKLEARRAYQRIKQREYIQRNPDYYAEYRAKNRDRLLECERIYRQKNKACRLEKYNRYRKNRKEADPLFRLTENIRVLIAKSCQSKNYSKASKTHQMLGCDYPFFKAYIESRFLPGMSWENRSLWHLDHIIPVSSAKTEGQLIKLNHYTNFRPLWAVDNIRKGNKVNTQLTLIAA